MKSSSLFACGLVALAVACGGQVSDRLGSPTEGTPKDVPTDVVAVPQTCVPAPDGPVATLDSCSQAQSGFAVDVLGVEWDQGSTPWAAHAHGHLHVRFRNQSPLAIQYPGAHVVSRDPRVQTPPPDSSLQLYMMSACSEYTELRAAFEPLQALPSGTKVSFDAQRIVATGDGIGDCGGKLSPLVLEVTVP